MTWILVVVPLPRSPPLCSRSEVPRTIPDSGREESRRVAPMRNSEDPDPESNSQVFVHIRWARHPDVSSKPLKTG